MRIHKIFHSPIHTSFYADDEKYYGDADLKITRFSNGDVLFDGVPFEAAIELKIIRVIEGASPPSPVKVINIISDDDDDKEEKKKKNKNKNKKKIVAREGHCSVCDRSFDEIHPSVRKNLLIPATEPFAGWICHHCDPESRRFCIAEPHKSAPQSAEVLTSYGGSALGVAWFHDDVVTSDFGRVIYGLANHYCLYCGPVDFGKLLDRLPALEGF